MTHRRGLALLLALGCTWLGCDPARADADGDGVPTSEDCDDSSPQRSRWEDGLFRDADGDGWTMGEAQRVCLGDTTPGWLPQRALQEDCDDANPNAWKPHTVYLDPDGDGAGEGQPVQVCADQERPRDSFLDATDCAPGDRWRWQMLPYLFRDADEDGATVPEPGQLCAGWELPPGYAAVASGQDCDDAQPARQKEWRLFPDADGDGVAAGSRETLCAGNTRPSGYVDSETDCAPADASRWQGFTYQYRDADGDTFTVEAGGSLCAGRTLPSGYGTTPRGNDCNDLDPGRYLELQGHADGDADGVGAGAAVAFCTSGGLPPGYVPTNTDCAHEDGTRWQLLSYAHVDADADTHTTPSAGQQCSGEALRPPFFTQASGNDCDDSDPTRFLARVLYLDSDGDGVGRPPRVVPCLGTSLPAGHSVFGFDPDDSDAAKKEPPEDELLELILGD